MSWLKISEEDTDLNSLAAEMLQMLKLFYENMERGHSINPYEYKANVGMLIAKAEEFMGKKEGSVFDAPDYERMDKNIGDSGEFDESHVDDKKKDQSVDPGSASTVPGSGADCSPDIPTGLT